MLKRTLLSFVLSLYVASAYASDEEGMTTDTESNDTSAEVEEMDTSSVSEETVDMTTDVEDTSVVEEDSSSVDTTTEDQSNNDQTDSSMAVGEDETTEDMSIDTATEVEESSVTEVAEETKTEAPIASKVSAKDYNKSIQDALNQQGSNLVVDGILGRLSRAALKSFQKKNGLPPTGKPDKKTLAKLGLS